MGGLKKYGVVVCFVFLFLIVGGVSGASALGIAGDVKTTFTFAPGLTKTVSASIVTAAGEGTHDYSIAPGCALGKYVTVYPLEILGLGPSAASKPFEATINLPSDLELECGIHEACVVVSSVDGDEGGGGLSIITKALIVQKIIIKALCPGKVFSYDFNFPQVRLGGISKVKLELHSGGEEPIGVVVGEVKVYNEKDEFVSDFSFQDASLEPGEEKTVTAQWIPADHDINLTSEYELYTAVVDVTYDGISAGQQETTFKVENDKIILFIEGGDSESGANNTLIYVLVISIGVLLIVILTGFIYLHNKIRQRKQPEW